MFILRLCKEICKSVKHGPKYLGNENKVEEDMC